MPNVALSPKAFAKEFTRGFAGAVRDAAGKDKRLSTNEAKSVSAPYRDNAENFLLRTEQKSVSVEKLIRSGYCYAIALGEKAAGPDGRISLADADSKLPADLKADYLKARGRLAPVAPAPDGALPAALIAQAEKFVKDNAGDNKAFPALDDGEMGVFAYALSGVKAERLVELAKLTDSRIADAYDPAKHLVVACRTTNDEETLFVSLVDRATGAGKVLTEIGMVDLPYSIDQATFDRLVPGMGALEDADHYEVIDEIVKDSTTLSP